MVIIQDGSMIEHEGKINKDGTVDYNEDGTVSQKGTYDNKYKNGNIVEQVLKTNYYDNEGKIRNRNKNKIIYTYYTSGDAKGREKNVTWYYEKYGKYVMSSASNYTYKFDKNGNVTEQVTKDSSGKIKSKVTYKYVGIKK